MTGCAVAPSSCLSELQLQPGWDAGGVSAARLNWELVMTADTVEMSELACAERGLGGPSSVQRLRKTRKGKAEEG